MLFNPSKDTLTIWYKNLSADSMAFRWFNGAAFDTINARLFKYDPEKKAKKFSLDIAPANPVPYMQEFHKPFEFTANHLLAKADPSFVTITEDSVPMKNFKLEIDSSNALKARLVFTRNSKAKYSYRILPGAFEDIFGLKNDTLRFDFSYRDELQYGSLVVNFAGAGDNNIIQLLSDNDYVTREAKISGTTSVTFNNLNPGFYRIKFISEANKNGKWDTGNYLRHIQPEETRYYPDKIVVRANWDVDVKWDLGN
jgi:hypothetical protein